MTDAEKETLKTEVSARVDDIVAAANKMDLEAIKQIYWDSPDFHAVSIDKVFGYEGYMKDTEEIWSGMNSINFQGTENRIAILDKETAYAIFGGLAEGVTTDGQEMKIEDFYASMLFRKIDGTWKVAGTHESGTFVMMGQDTAAIPADTTMAE